MRKTITTAMTALLLAMSLAPGGRAQTDPPTDHVDPMIGTFPPGFTNPGPLRPHGMVHVGPDTEGPFNYGGYLANNALITGFSHIHMSAGVPQGGQFPLLPIVGDPQTAPELPALPAMPPLAPYASPFERLGEASEAGYYSVNLLRYGIRTELTATERVGLHRYTYPPIGSQKLVFHPGRDLKGTQDATIRLADERTILASVSTRSPEHTVYAAMRVDRPVAATTLAGEPLSAGEGVSGSGIGVILDAPGDPTLRVDVGISFVGTDGALANLEAESDLGDFDRIRQQAREDWSQVLSAIRVEGGTTADLETFYTALYRARSFPSLLSDVDGRYPGPDDQIHQDSRPHYTNFSMWDSYRGHNALLAVLDPERYRDFMVSLRDFAAQSGRLPRWQLANRDPAYMSGNPVIPLLAEGICRGLAEPALEAALYEQAWDLVAEERPEVLTELGYLPVASADNPVELIEGGGGRDAGRTLEYSVADAALALLAHRRDLADDLELALEGAARWRNLLDPGTRWIRPRETSGEWASPFLPESGYGFQEGTSWQYSWLVMHDMAGLIEAMGGRKAVIARLDTMFAFPLTATVPVVWPKIQNQLTVFGLFYIGNQFAPGNEHNLQIPFLYNWAGAPWKTQAVARGASSVYTPNLDGLPGNDDLGALSGWLVWTMLGLHPTVPGAPGYAVASPVFERVMIDTPRRAITIEARGASALNRFVSSVAVDGRALEKPWLTEHDLDSAGSVIRFEMAALPDQQWGATTPPPSFSTHPLDDFGCQPAGVLASEAASPAELTAPSLGNSEHPQAALPATGGGAVSGGLVLVFSALVLGLLRRASRRRSRRLDKVNEVRGEGQWPQ